MSVIIEGMDVPETCAGCFLSRYDDGYRGGYGYGTEGYWCPLLKIYVPERSRREDCPIKEYKHDSGNV